MKKCYVNYETSLFRLKNATTNIFRLITFTYLVVNGALAIMYNFYCNF